MTTAPSPASSAKGDDATPSDEAPAQAPAGAEAPAANDAPPTRVETLAPWIVGVLLAIPVLAARYPPMTDLPLHEGLVGILRSFHDTSMFPSGLYVRNFGEPNQLFHLVAWALSYVVATDTACKLIVAAIVIAIPVGAARFATYAGANRLAAVVVAPIALGWMFSWGLVANLLGLAVFLALLPTVDRLAQKPTPRAALLAIGGAALLYLAHYAMMIVFAGAALWLTVCHPLKLRASLLRVSPFVASFAIAVGHAKYQEQFKSPVVSSIGTIWVSVPAKLLQVPSIVLPTYDRTTQWALFGLFALSIVLFLVLRSRERTEPVPRNVRAFLLRYRFELFAAASFGAYLAFPLTLNGATLVYQRFFPAAFATFVVVAAPRSLATRAARVTRLLVPAVPVGALLMAWPSFADSHQSYKDLDHILSHMQKGSAVASLDLATSESRTFSLGAAPARYLATGGGRIHYAFTDSSIAPALLVPEYQWNEPLVRISKNGWAFRPSHDFKRFRYVIVRSIDANLLALAAHAMKPEGRVIANAGEWLLVESTLDLVPLTSPDVPLPTPKPPSLRKRMDLALDKLMQENPQPPPELGPEIEP